MRPTLQPAAHTSAGLAQAWDQLGRAGGWYTGSERVAIARQTRVARECGLCAERKAALSPYAVSGEHADDSGPLSGPTVDVIHRIATDPGRLSKRWYVELTDAGMRAEELVEITSIVGLTTIADTLARALSRPERPLPAAQKGEPHRRTVSGTTIERAWVPMVEPESAEGMVKMMYDNLQAEIGFVFNVARALTSVPEAVRDFFAAFLPNYATHGPVAPGGLDRSQVELLTSSTSAWNDCFY